MNSPIFHQKYPRRFRSYEDAQLFMACNSSSTKLKEFPPEKIVWPKIVKNGKSVSNPEYENAPYELGITHILTSEI